MPPDPQILQINQQRLECVALANRRKQPRALMNRYRDELQHTQDLEECEQILRIIE